MIDWDTQPMRSLHFVPGGDERKLTKATGMKTDVAVIDLEDAVADDRKIAARATARSTVPRFRTGVAVAVRVNAITSGLLEDDVAAVVTEGLDAIVVPKVEDVATLHYAAATVAAAERGAGAEPGRIRLIALIETARGLARCESLLAAAPDRVHAVAFGPADLASDLGLDVGPEATELLYARSRLVIAARAAGLPAPIDGPWLGVDDLEGLIADSARSRRLGFQGRMTLHPSQVGPVLHAYGTLGDGQLARLRRIVTAFEESQRSGVAALRLDGEFVDYPIYRQARDRLRRHEASATGRQRGE